MGIQHYGYNDDVCQVLDGKQPDLGTSLRFGAEVETGWHHSADRELFFEHLNRAKLDRHCISKHDTSIMGREYGAPSEIVTKPLSAPKLTAALGLIGEQIEALSDKVWTSNCGVHIHVSKAALSAQERWRMVTAIMPALHEIKPARYNTIAEEFNYLNELNSLNDFWTLLALRKPGRYCNRSPYSSSKEFERAVGQHGSAVTMGAHTPTVEFRLFKTPRSANVLRSYGEAIAALVSFSKDAGHEFFAAPTIAAEDPTLEIQKFFIKTLTSEQWMQMGFPPDKRGGIPLTWVAASSGVTQHFKSCMELSAKHAKALTLAYFHQNYYSGFPEAVWTEAVQTFRAKLLAYTKYTGVMGWNGLFPVRTYCEYVLSNPRQYPALAKRLQLPKFSLFVTGELAVTVESDNTPYDNDKEHSRIKYGCLVKDEQTQQINYRVVGVTKAITNRDQKVVNAEDINLSVREVRGTPGLAPQQEQWLGEESLNADRVIHLCKGALTKGGHDE